MNYSTKSEFTQEHPLVSTARQHAPRPALQIGNSALTYAALLSHSERLAQLLANRGVQPGQVIAIGHLPVREMIISIWGCMLGGFVVFPLNIRFPDNSLASILEEVNPALIISDSSLPGHEVISWDTLNSPGKQEKTSELPAFDLFAPASLLMTSGSSGTVKYVQHSYYNHIESAKGSNHNIPITSSDSWLLTLPLYHVGGLSILFRSALSAASIIMPMSQQSILNEIIVGQVTHISLVATQLTRLLSDNTSLGILKSMKAILLGGSAIPAALIQKALDHELPIHVSYGSTEMASQVTTTEAHNRKAALHNSGKPLPGRDLIISHEGEILVKGDTLAQGYVQHGELVNLRDENGWFHTGDVGYVNVQGELTVTGRMDNQFISGGENVQPEHIESILCQIPGIMNAIVIPQDDEAFGNRPVAFIESQDEAPPGDIVTEQLRRHLPGYMLPVAYYKFPDLTTESSFKISRQTLTKLLQTKNKYLHSLKY